jgi:hypothetical protein
MVFTPAMPAAPGFPVFTPLVPVVGTPRPVAGAPKVLLPTVVPVVVVPVVLVLVLELVSVVGPGLVPVRGGLIPWAQTGELPIARAESADIRRTEFSRWLFRRVRKIIDPPVLLLPNLLLFMMMRCKAYAPAGNVSLVKKQAMRSYRERCAQIGKL